MFNPAASKLDTLFEQKWNDEGSQQEIPADTNTHTDNTELPEVYLSQLRSCEICFDSKQHELRSNIHQTGTYGLDQTKGYLEAKCS